MKILVPIKKAIDDVPPHLQAHPSIIEASNIKQTINPFCEQALLCALSLKTQHPHYKIIATTIGKNNTKHILTQAIALGADRAIFIKAKPHLEPLWSAQYLKKLVKEEKPDCVILGSKNIGNDWGQTGQMLAAMLGWQQGTHCSSLKIDKQQALMTRQIDGHTQTLSLTLPCVLTIGLGVFKPRVPSFFDLVKAHQKHQTHQHLIENKLSFDDDINLKPALNIKAILPYKKKTKNVKTDNPETFLSILKELGARQ